MALLLRKVFSCSTYICCFVQMQAAGVRTTILRLDSDIKGGLEVLLCISDGAICQIS